MHTRLSHKLVVATVSAGLLTACLPSKMVSEEPVLDDLDVPPVTLVISRLVADRSIELDDHGVGPQGINLELQRALQHDLDVSDVVLEEDIPLSGLERPGKVYLVKFKIDDYDHTHKTNGGGWAIFALSWTVIPLFFSGCVRSKETEDMLVRVKLYDVTNASMERIKNENTADYFNAYDVSSINPLVNESHELSVKWLDGWDNEAKLREFILKRERTWAYTIAAAALEDIEPTLTAAVGLLAQTTAPKPSVPVPGPVLGGPAGAPE